MWLYEQMQLEMYAEALGTDLTPKTPTTCRRRVFYAEVSEHRGTPI